MIDTEVIHSVVATSEFVFFDKTYNFPEEAVDGSTDSYYASAMNTYGNDGYPINDPETLCINFRSNYRLVSWKMYARYDYGQ